MARRTTWLVLTLMTGALAAPAAADTKAGVDAWGRGDYATAVAEWRRGAVAGEADAQVNLGTAYKLGRGVPVDLKIAEEWFRKAAAQGNEQGEDAYGLILFQVGKRIEALPWLRKSAERGQPRAQLVLGTMLYNGDGLPRDWPRAYALILRANAQGLPQAAPVLAQMDRYVSTEDRQRGAVLARELEAKDRQPQLPPELAGGSAAGPAKQLPKPAPVADAKPKPPAKPAPRPAPAVAGKGWRLQLGAFRDDGNAHALFDRLKGRVPGMAPLQPYMVKAGSMTRLQAGPIATSEQAAKLCAAVKAAGAPCLTVAP